MGRTQHRIRPAGTYFATVKACGGRQLFKGTIAELLVDQLMACRQKGVFLLHEFCVLPDHLHVLFTPTEGTTLEKAGQMIKGGASYRVRRERPPLTLWQAGYHDWRCRSENDYQSYAAYIRENPVKAGLADKPETWPFSSANPRFSEFGDTMPQGLKAPSGEKKLVSTLKG